MLIEHARYSQAIAAIVSWPGHHGDPASGRIARANRIGDGCAGPLHQIDARNPAGDGQPVGQRHFGIAQKLKHR